MLVFLVFFIASLSSQRDAGQVGGYFAMNLTMPTMLGWVLGGNTSALARSARVPFCRVGDKPKAFCESVRGAHMLAARKHCHSMC